MHSRHVMQVVENSLGANVVRLDDYRRSRPRPRTTRDLVTASLLLRPDVPKK